MNFLYPKSTKNIFFPTHTPQLFMVFDPSSTAHLIQAEWYTVGSGEKVKMTLSDLTWIPEIDRWPFLREFDKPGAVGE